MTRRATNNELAQHLAFEIRHGRRAMFRHFVREVYAPAARNGVRHVQYGRARVQLVDGVPHVRHHGRMQALTATWQDTDAGGVPYPKPLIFDVRLDSPHL